MSALTIKNFILASTFLVLSAGGFFYMANEIERQGTVLLSRVEALQIQQRQENSFFRLQKTAEDSVEERAELTSYFLQKDSDSITFLNQVEQLAPVAGIDLETESLRQFTDPQNQNWIQVDFSFSGTQRNVQNFVQVLENIPYLSQITALSLSIDSAAAAEARLSMQVLVLLYDE